MWSGTRRQFVQAAALVGGSALLGGLWGCTSSSRAPVARLNLMGPSTPPTVLLAHLAQQAEFQERVPGVSFAVAKSPDLMRASLASGDVQVAAIPTLMAANLYQKGAGVQLLNVTGWGFFYLLARGDGFSDWADLKGRRAAIAFKGDMPDLILRYLARANDVDLARDLDLTYTSSTTEAAQFLLADQADLALLPEPSLTATLAQAKQKGIPVRIQMDLQEEWGRVTGGAARIPLVGTVVASSLLAGDASLGSVIDGGLKASVDWVVQHPEEAATFGSAHLGGVKPELLAEAWSRISLAVVPAREARAELEFFYERLKEISPEIIGGDLPDDHFYA